MKTKTVMVLVEIPVGYGLDDGKQPRYGFNGELALDWSDDGIAGLIGGYSGQTRKKHYILVKESKPTKGKACMVSDFAEDVGTENGHVVVFRQMRDGWYVDNKGMQWAHCWPIPADVIWE